MRKGFEKIVMREMYVSRKTECIVITTKGVSYSDAPEVKSISTV